LGNPEAQAAEELLGHEPPNIRAGIGHDPPAAPRSPPNHLFHESPSYAASLFEHVHTVKQDGPLALHIAGGRFQRYGFREAERTVSGVGDQDLKTCVHLSDEVPPATLDQGWVMGFGMAAGANLKKVRRLKPAPRQLGRRARVAITHSHPPADAAPSDSPGRRQRPAGRWLRAPKP
jgi:hypothetical protein